MTHQINDYGVVYTKTPREVVLLNTVGGCSWAKCAFCDYCNTFGRTALDAEKKNRETLSKVTGSWSTLQIICSANFIEVPTATWFALRQLCNAKNIKTLILETHWIHREHDYAIRQFFKGIRVEMVYGIETFNYNRREVEWFKGYGHISIEELKLYADAINLLIGVRGQTLDEIKHDIILALNNFKKVFIYVFETNDSDVQRDNALIDAFYNSDLFATLKNQINVEILDGMDSRAPDNLGFVGTGARYN